MLKVGILGRHGRALKSHHMLTVFSIRKLAQPTFGQDAVELLVLSDFLLTGHVSEAQSSVLSLSKEATGLGDF